MSLKLNLACGHVSLPKEEGWINLDKLEGDHVDITCTVPPIPFDDESIDYILASHFLEHVPRGETFIELMNECWRILKPGGIMHIECPLAGTTWYYQDPTHVNPIVPELFDYMIDKYMYLRYGFKVWSSHSVATEGWIVKGDLIK